MTDVWKPRPGYLPLITRNHVDGTIEYDVMREWPYEPTLRYGMELIDYDPAEAPTVDYSDAAIARLRRIRYGPHFARFSGYLDTISRPKTKTWAQRPHPRPRPRSRLSKTSEPDPA